MAVSYRLLISEYIVREYSRLEADLREAEKEIFWGEYDARDVARLELVRMRFDVFKEFANNVMIMLKVTDSDVDDYVAELRRLMYEKEHGKKYKKREED